MGKSCNELWFPTKMGVNDGTVSYMSVLQSSRWWLSGREVEDRSMSVCSWVHWWPTDATAPLAGWTATISWLNTQPPNWKSITHTRTHTQSDGKTNTQSDTELDSMSQHFSISLLLCLLQPLRNTVPHYPEMQRQRRRRPFCGCAHCTSTIYDTAVTVFMIFNCLNAYH